MDGKKVIEQFWDLNFIKEPSNIFNLDYNKIRKLEGWETSLLAI